MGTAVDFRDLLVWQKGHQLVRGVYACISTFPRLEQKILIQQLCRATVSVTSNIAEGHGRFSHKDKVRFYITARGSLVEVQNQLLVARDVGYLSNDHFLQLYNQTTETLRLLNGMIRSVRNRSSTVP